MKITDLVANSDKPTFSLEALPFRSLDAAGNLARFQGLLQRKPLFVDFPFHAGRMEAAAPDGKISSDFPTSEKLSRELLETYGATPLVHLLCRGFTPEQTEKKLRELQQMGVQNLLLLRGDAPENASVQSHKYAYQLVDQVQEFNRKALFQPNKVPFPNGFCIGVAGYPYPTPENPDYNQLLQHLKRKVEAGAGFIITQLFFDNARFFAFEKDCRDVGITVPILPGICPVTNLKMLHLLPGFFRVPLPEPLEDEFRSCQTEQQLVEAGTSWAIQQAKDLLGNGVKTVHFFSLAEPEHIERVVDAVF